MKFTIYQASRQGGRKNNQDRVAYSYSREALLMVVADGMGGHMHGEIAAQITVQTLTEQFQKMAKPRLADSLAFLAATITRAHYAINDYAVDQDLMEIPHTTCVAAVIQDNTAYWAHVGDSRLYLFSAGSLIARTEDHTAVAQLVREGLISEEEAGTHPERNKVSNCLGGYVTPQVECGTPIPLHDTDTMLLCTDGIWGMISIAEASALLHAYTLEDAVRHLMDHAEFRGGEHGDNLSLVAMTWGEPRMPSKDSISTLAMPAGGITTQLNSLSSVPGAVAVTDDEIERAIAEIQQAIKNISSK
ncbi:MAG: protein phosphatase 2C domain-containing protein [Thiobacillus sp.]|uniref:PP2C family protein-serine/threonine phosphatase n=1 Tax=Thiobacillus sp. TaxID=924 RepID=UPI00289396B3|nr:protein phosphatase 2C domain-containing protein [Thiobacillus sp.]MDT3708120.1 protein phosphatase 2C domain-containing protein [Thiobacillus sp.]